MAVTLFKFAGGVVRVFLFADGRDAINFSNMTFYDQAKLYDDMETLLEAADISGVKVIPVLFDYLMAYGAASGDSGHPEAIKDAVKRAQLMSLMSSFIGHFSNRDEILMWDLMNEPYYGTSASPYGDQKPTPTMSTVSVEEMRTFLNGLLGTTRAADPGKQITIGFESKEIMDIIREEIGKYIPTGGGSRKGGGMIVNKPGKLSEYLEVTMFGLYVGKVYVPEELI